MCWPCSRLFVSCAYTSHFNKITTIRGRGLGKTLQTISIMGYLKETKKARGVHLVVVRFELCLADFVILEKYLIHFPAGSNDNAWDLDERTGTSILFCFVRPRLFKNK